MNASSSTDLSNRGTYWIPEAPLRRARARAPRPTFRTRNTVENYPMPHKIPIIRHASATGARPPIETPTPICSCLSFPQAPSRRGAPTLRGAPPRGPGLAPKRTSHSQPRGPVRRRGGPHRRAAHARAYAASRVRCPVRVRAVRARIWIPPTTRRAHLASRRISLRARRRCCSRRHERI